MGCERQEAQGVGLVFRPIACKWFTEGFDTKDLKDAKTLLEKLE